MALFNKLNDLAKNIGDKTTDAIETGKLNAKINSQRNAAGEELKKIGEYYYNIFVERGEAAPEVLEFCQRAKDHYDTAAEAQAAIDRIRDENQAAQVPVAPSPVQPAASGFPAQADPAGIACPNCGTVNPSGTRFCHNCGTKVEVEVQIPVPVEHNCPSCGAENPPGSRFCQSCGYKLG